MIVIAGVLLPCEINDFDDLRCRLKEGGENGNYPCLRIFEFANRNIIYISVNVPLGMENRFWDKFSNGVQSMDNIY